MQISMKKVNLRESDLLAHLGTFQYFNWSSDDMNLNDIKLSFFVEPDLNGFISLFPSWLMFFVVFVFPLQSLKIRCINHMMPFCCYFLRIFFPLGK